MLAKWLINHLMCGISVGLPKGQFFYVITLDQQVIHIYIDWEDFSNFKVTRKRVGSN